MLCDDCKKRPASVHITKIVNNDKIERHLCNECAKSLGEMSLAAFAMDNKFSVQDFLKGMFNYGFGDGAQPVTEAACRNCGMTYSEFSRNGKIGCSTCYTTFGERLEPLLRRIHGSSAHTGKIPKRSGGELEVKQRLKRLKQELAKHIVQEEYELAAKIRDEIRSVEKKMTDMQANNGQ
ncbi:hypothetical protein P22_3896 [Propionispora sp. 2/2-37]|uniref:UvrB/UvrC motif-containing protein n=1 Tax=Propionispora sp. 2/2-37 TaxID=1677858 RepID=UPI0006BB5DAF|nr:UvrB/UvrC motif-containing protein [Propionispora sp. 2/2-37]CUH97752.1 hypothetical protein P22_3896 [Propionispora sp. 2/2-37]